jgi:rhamnosyltransferase
MNKLCSLIIRTKNEERWISSCLNAVYKQNYTNFEVILVDNRSTDKTVQKAKKFPIDKVVDIDEYIPGRALNVGVESSKGEYIVCLSGHCIPTNNNWLGNLVQALEEHPTAAGVYGRQEPMSFSSSSDKRDLILVFGLDKKIQVNDSFFHNANSIIRRELWKKSPFDNNLTNIEDRAWGQKMQSLGYTLVYEPAASVYHYHGIHQNSDSGRCANVVNIIESLDPAMLGGVINIDSYNIVALIPIKGESQLIGKKIQMKYTIDHIKKSKHINSFVVSTDNEKTLESAKLFGATTPFLRPKELSEDHISLEEVLQYSVIKMEEQGVYADLIILLEESYIFRDDNLIDSMIERLIANGLDSIIAAKVEINSIWQEANDKSYQRLDSGDVPRKFKEKTYIGIEGLCVVTRPEYIRTGVKLGLNVGLFHVNNSLSFIETRDNEGRKTIQHLCLLGDNLLP